ncbi:transmembrane protein 88B isoform X2 [Lutra lutra]|uniref:transmembrane protein 88B isoform X2 n=1 Tax=Lutra lutra TaxID=9657 RepID=UPI001FD5520D|nr:transmembrane protein 88B isoform X2 [Lutra lutra]
MSEQEKETEEDEGGGTSDTAPMLPGRLPDCQASALMSPGWVGLAVNGSGTLLLPGQALAGLLLQLLLPSTVFLLVLLPPAAIVYLGFLCHSRAKLELQPVPHSVSPAIKGGRNTIESHVRAAEHPPGDGGREGTSWQRHPCHLAPGDLCPPSSTE